MTEDDGLSDHGKDRPDALEGLLDEQITHYRALAAEYDDHALPFAGDDEVLAALEAFAPRGRVLELACGPGPWTERLLRHADHVTAVDASPEMLALAAARVARAGGAQDDGAQDDGAQDDGQGDGRGGGNAGERATDRVRFVQADLFSWEPDGRYEVVFFSLWLSHVPLERFDSFWGKVARSLAPDGRVFFVDDAYRTPDELIEGEASSTIRRRLNDGTTHRIVKVPHEPADLERRLSALGWTVSVHGTAGPLYWGQGTLT